MSQIRGEARTMEDLKSLLKRARRSGGGEAYASIARGAGVRVGLGVRTVRGRSPSVFVEVVLEPFPERPRVNPDRLARQTELITLLSARGYAITCHDGGTIACERTVVQEQARREVREIVRILETPPSRERVSSGPLRRG